ncbi:hypothetical protein [Acinetobacter gyllenbergii]|nr:hypothetical protein [Acinetobacter gyllenbergii]
MKNLIKKLIQKNQLTKIHATSNINGFGVGPIIELRMGVYKMGGV